MKRKLTLATLSVCLTLVWAGIAQASITGTPIGGVYGWTPNSTNALNYALLTPGRVGQVAPFVILDSTALGSVTLNFNNFASGLAFFEIRLDGIATGTSAHPVVAGDTIHTGGKSVSTGTSSIHTYFASSTVDVRLALGGERDWDFNWTRFEVGRAVVPEPTTAIVWSLLGMSSVCLLRRRH